MDETKRKEENKDAPKQVVRPVSSCSSEQGWKPPRISGFRVENSVGVLAL